MQLASSTAFVSHLILIECYFYNLSSIGLYDDLDSFLIATAALLLVANVSVSFGEFTL